MGRMETAFRSRSDCRDRGSDAGCQSGDPDGRDNPEQELPVYPGTCGRAHAALAGHHQSGDEYLVVRTAAGAKAVMLVTVENGPLTLQYGAEKIGKGQQIQVDGSDFPTLAASGLHSPAELERVRSITGKPFWRLLGLGRPGRPRASVSWPRMRTSFRCCTGTTNWCGGWA